MPNPKDATIRLFCALQGKVQHALGDYSKAADCFCNDNKMPDNYYRNDHKTFEFIANAVDKALEERGDHFPGCHKVHIECANKAIDEARNLIADQLPEFKARERHKDFRDHTEWLERWKDKE